jgi:hypothetical protein
MSRDNNDRLRLCELRLERTECYKRILEKRAENIELSERSAHNDAFIALQQRRQVKIDEEVLALEQNSIRNRMSKIREGAE